MNTADETDAWLMCFIYCSLPSIFISVCPLVGLRRIHLHLLCVGDGRKDGGSWDLWPSLLPGGHLEQAGLLHRHGWVSTHVVVFALILVKVCMS